MKKGDKIRVTFYIVGRPSHTKDFIVEEFRYCLGIFTSEQARLAGNFTPLCKLYKPGPSSEEKYIPNYGAYFTNMIPAWINLSKRKEV